MSMAMIDAYAFSHDTMRQAFVDYSSGNKAPLTNIWNAVRSYGFPYKRKWMVKTPCELYESLCLYASNVNADTRSSDLDFDVMSPSAIDVKRFMRVPYDDHHYFMNMITDWFTEPARMRCKKMFSYPTQTPLEQFDSSVPYLLEEVYQKKQDVTPETIRDAMYTYSGSMRHPKFSEASGHGVTKALFVFKKLDATRILDPCAGYGDRCIAALAAGTDEYVGVDVNADLIGGHSEILSTLPGAASRARFIYAPFESDEVALPANHFTLVYTSPPYGQTQDTSVPLESYGCDPSTQHDRSNFSTVKFSGARWVDWFYAMLAKAWRALAVDGHMVIHISDHRTNRIVGRMQRYVMYGLGGTFLGVIGMEGAQPVASPLSRRRTSSKCKAKLKRDPYPAWVFLKSEE